ADFCPESIASGGICTERAGHKKTANTAVLIRQWLQALHYRGNRLVQAEFATLAIVHTIRKLAKLERTDMGHRAF
ncbi:MAG: hypothetical protein IJR73_05260, partial [Bacteroidales bacterium]|nr:hypothetical protein [Bacteroidales bacterium]